MEPHSQPTPPGVVDRKIARPGVPGGNDGLFNVEPRNRLFERATAADSSSADDTQVTGLTPDVTPASILIVEDEGIVAQDLKEALRRRSYRIAGVAGEGTQAVAMAEQLRPELVVMDVS